VALENWPTWVNQLSGETLDDDGVADNPWNDCGPACVRAVGIYLGKGDVYADEIRDWIAGIEGSHGYTLAVDLARYMREVWSLDVVVIPGSGAPETVRTALDNGWPVIALTAEPAGYNATVGYWQRTPFNHFCPYIGYSDAHITRHQVLGGYSETLSWQEWQRRFLGWLIVVRQAKE
jgi:hypothetical protein